MEETKGKNRFIVLELLKKLKSAFKSLVGNEGNIDEKLERKFEETLQDISTQSRSQSESNEGIQRISPEKLIEKGEVISDPNKLKSTIDQSLDNQR